MDLKNLFGAIINKNKKDSVKKPSKSAPAQRNPGGKPASKKKAAEQAKARARAKSNKPQNSQSSRQIAIEKNLITRIDSLPKHERIISGEFGEFNIGEIKRRDYIVLLASEKQKVVDIIRSVESMQSRGVDNNFQTMKADLKHAGYRYASCYFASRPLISLLYDRQVREGNEQDVVENASDLARDFDLLLAQSLDENISDVHIEVRRDTAQVRMRRNGIIQQKHEWSVQYARDMAIVVYQVLAVDKDVTFVPNQAQDAVVERRINNIRVRVRLATIPASPDGFDMVLRILPIGISSKLIPISDLGYLDNQIQTLAAISDKPVGATIIAGVTGSGKSTSMSTILSHKIQDHKGTIKVITVENPPENVIVGATQSPVVLSRDGKDGGNPFASAIKAAMRSDPDVLMIGEVRDEDSAELLVHATQSGHQTLTTLHTPSAFAIPSRLRSFGIPNDVLGSADFLAGLIYQSLVQTLCAHCSIPYEQRDRISRAQSEALGRAETVLPDNDLFNINLRNREGCSECESGIKGRTVIAEVIFPSVTMKQHFANAEDQKAELEFLKKGGMLTIHTGIEKVRAGLVDPLDLEKKVGRIDSVLEYVEMSGLGCEHFRYRKNNINGIINDDSSPEDN